MRPLLAQTYQPHRVAGPCFLQPKFNGVRALYQAGTFQSRDELPWPKDFLKHLTEPLLKMFPDERIILDGELYVHGWNLQRINQAVAVNATVRGATEDTLSVSYYVFDRVSFTLPFYHRFQEVEGVIRHLQHLNILAATTVQPPNPQWVEDFYANTVAEGFEGIMYRMGDCPYTTPKLELWNGQRPPGRLRAWSDQDNRVWHLLKRKGWQDGEFTCKAIVEGEGKRAGMVGAFQCWCWSGHFGGTTETFFVGSGLTDAEATHYFQHPEEVIGHKIKVKYLTLTTDGKPFNPTIEAIL